MTPKMTLRAVEANDLPVLYAQQLDPAAQRMAVFPPRDWRAFEAHWKKILADETLVARAIVMTGRVAGYVSLFGPPDERLVGYWIGQEYWGRGIATAALASFVEQIGERPLYAHVAKTNVGSIRVLEKCGFTVCREERATDFAGGEPVEEWVMTLHGGPYLTR
jgi:RimJ/RimL family protein N-acetyltransferase